MASSKNNWKEQVICGDHSDLDFEYYVFIDETGCSEIASLAKLYKKNPVSFNVPLERKYFTLTAVVVSKDTYKMLCESITALKFKYWDKGMYKGKRVVFHSYEIRRRISPFNLDDVKYDCFIGELSQIIRDLDMVIFACHVDKQAYFLKYFEANNMYSYSLTLILERIVKTTFISGNPTVGIVFESRGKQEDQVAHARAMHSYYMGTRYVNSILFRRIKGVYFNQKRTSNNLKSYPGLEIADLCSYPIHRACVHDNWASRDIRALLGKIRRLKQIPSKIKKSRGPN